MFKAIVSAARFFWTSTAGYRLRPWRSPYLRWRLETFTGKPAATLRSADFLHLFYTERRQMGHFFRWLGSLRQIANGKRP